jgi:flagellar motor protein MotB
MNRQMVAQAPKKSSTPAASGVLQRKCDKCREKDKLLQRSAVGSAPETMPPIVHEVLRSPGQPLDAATRAFMEPRFGHDFSRVRVHTDREASKLNYMLGARAFTAGRDIFFQEGHYKPANSEGRRLLAHELTHVVQQNSGEAERQLAIGETGDRYEQEAEAIAQSLGNRNAEGNTKEGQVGEKEIMRSGRVRSTQNVPAIQRRLVVTFDKLPDLEMLLKLLGQRSGLSLSLDPANFNQVKIDSVLPAAPQSPSLRKQLRTIINHAAQHAEIHVGRGQREVMVGTFPVPYDLTRTRVQKIDIDDILKIERGAPGSGVAFAAHEIQENFVAHATAPIAGISRFPPAHQAAISLESSVATELVGKGARVAEVNLVLNPPLNPGIKPVKRRIIFDYENYYMVFRTIYELTGDIRVTSVRRRPKVKISKRTIANFSQGSDFIPANNVIALAIGDINANPSATVRIEGFADDMENLGGLSRASLRAESVKQLLSNNVDGLRIYAKWRGRNNFAFANDTPAHRSLNRRVVITVARPG